MPYFTIIIPTLNEEKYLPRLLTDLNQQSFTDFEVIIVDGQSKDTTPLLVKSYQAKYPLSLLSTSTRHVSYQRNLGASKAKSKILIFFDADTQIPKTYLLKIKHSFETKHPHVLTTWMKADSKKSTDRLLATSFNLIMETGRIIGTIGCFGAMIAIKKGVFEDIGGFDEITKFGEDRQLVQTAVNYHYKFIILPEPKFMYSFRRFRSEGTMESIIEGMRLNLAIMAKGFHDPALNYPMGGHVFKKPYFNSASIDWMHKLTKRFKKASTVQRASIKKLFAQFFT